MSGAPAARRWTRADYAHDPESLAVRLLGALLVRRLPGTGERLAGVIVETEAYLGEVDRAAHSFGGRRTARVEAMYGPPGTAYVYFTYGMHHCFNIACGAEGQPVAVLVRAIRPIEGVDAMRSLRERGRSSKPIADKQIGSGPAKLCQAMQIDLGLSGVDLASPKSPVWVEDGVERPEAIGRGPRIGVGYAEEWAAAELRWWVEGDPHVSR